jgi:hypothetical protein
MTNSAGSGASAGYSTVEPDSSSLKIKQLERMAEDLLSALLKLPVVHPKRNKISPK